MQNLGFSDRHKIFLQVELSYMMACSGRRRNSFREPDFSWCSKGYVEAIGEADRVEKAILVELCPRKGKTSYLRSSWEAGADERKRLFDRMDSRYWNSRQALKDSLQNLRTSAGPFHEENGIEPANLDGWLSAHELTADGPELRVRAKHAYQAWEIPPREHGSSSTELPMSEWPELPVPGIGPGKMLSPYDAERWHGLFMEIYEFKMYREMIELLSDHFDLYDEFPSIESNFGKRQFKSMDALAHHLVDLWELPIDKTRSTERKKAMMYALTNFAVSGKARLNETPALFNTALSKSLGREFTKRRVQASKPSDI